MKQGTTKGALTAADFEPRSASEQRIEARYENQRKIHILPCFTEEDWKFLSADLVDCSAHGLGFVIDQPMNLGQDFLVKLEMEKVVLLLYTVRYCVADGNRFRVGARFSGLATDPVRRDPQAVLEALLKPPQ